MSDDKAVTDVIIERYALHLLNGNSINNTPILVGTIFHYMTAVNDYYKTNRRHPPFDRKGDTNANKLLNKQKEYEDVAAKREPLHDKVILMMKLMADKSIHMVSAEPCGSGQLSGDMQDFVAKNLRWSAKKFRCTSSRMETWW